MGTPMAIFIRVYSRPFAVEKFIFVWAHSRFGHANLRDSGPYSRLFASIRGSKVYLRLGPFAVGKKIHVHLRLDAVVFYARVAYERFLSRPSGASCRLSLT